MFDKEVAKTLRRSIKLRIESGELRICFNGKLKMENGKLYRINWHDERLSKSVNNIGATPSLISEGKTPTLTSDLEDLYHDRHSEAVESGDPSLTLRMTTAEESRKKFSIFNSKQSPF